MVKPGFSRDLLRAHTPDRVADAGWATRRNQQVEQDRAQSLLAHRMNWRAKPLIRCRVIVDLIGAATTETGLTVRCELDTGRYREGTAVKDQEMAEIDIRPCRCIGRMERHDRSRTTAAQIERLIADGPSRRPPGSGERRRSGRARVACSHDEGPHRAGLEGHSTIDGLGSVDTCLSHRMVAARSLRAVFASRRDCLSGEKQHSIR